MKRSNKIISVLITFITALGLVSCSTQNTAVAIVNGEKITKDEFNYFLTTVKAQIQQEQQGSDITEDFWETAEVDGKKVIETAKEKALEEAVKAKVAKQEAVKAGVKISSAQHEDINNRIGKLVAQHGKNGIDEYLTEQYGIDKQLFEKLLEDSFYKQNLMDQITSDVSDSDAKEFFNSKIVRVKHILIMTVDQQTQQPLAAEKVEAAKVKADELLSQAKSGADFDKLVEENSEDPGSKQSPEGYYLGKGFALGMQGGMVPAFETASLVLEVGGISDVVETNYGYHIIKRYENDPSEYDKNPQEVLQRAKSAKFDEMLETWKNEAKIEKNEKVYNSIK